MNFRIFVGENYENFQGFVKELEEKEWNIQKKYNYTEMTDEPVDAYLLVNKKGTPLRIVPNMKYQNNHLAETNLIKCLRTICPKKVISAMDIQNSIERSLKEVGGKTK